jgi:hypothetical protein
VLTAPSRTHGGVSEWTSQQDIVSFVQVQLHHKLVDMCSRGGHADFGRFLTLKSFSDPCQSTIGNELAKLILFEPSDYAQDTIKCGIEYKWTITCVLVVQICGTGNFHPSLFT